MGKKVPCKEISHAMAQELAMLHVALDAGEVCYGDSCSW